MLTIAPTVLYKKKKIGAEKDPNDGDGGHKP
jgi:hypothetical protein